MRKILSAALAAVALGAAAARAQDISVSAQADPTQVGVGETITLVVTVQGKTNISGEPVLPDLPDFQVYGAGRSSNFTFVNGQVSSSLQFTYMLVPKRAGNFTIGPITLAQGGMTYSTAPIAVQVGGGGPAPAAPVPGAGQAPAPGQIPVPQGHENEGAFITTTVDRREVYVNEPVTLTFRFYTRVPVLSQPQYTPPDLTGFWSEDLPPQRQFVTRVNGAEYNVTEIQSALFPTSAGRLTIGSARLVVQVADFGRRGFDPFDDPFFRSFFSRGQSVTLTTQPISITVKPLPTTGRPPEFTGTVGKWSLSAGLDRRQAKVGEAVTLEVRISGEGNVKAVGKLEVPVLTGFKVYDTISSSEVKKTSGRVQGVKVFRTLLRPEVTGTLTVPPLKYSYFDPRSGRYEQVAVPALSLEVGPGEGAAASPGGAVLPAGPALSAPGVRMVSQDIRYLKTEFPVVPPPRPWPAWVWLAGFGLPPLGLLAAWAWRRHRDRLETDPVFARRLAAARNARQALSQARTARQHHRTAEFYAALSQALTGYLADQLGLSRAGVTQRELLRSLAAAGAGEPARSDLAALLEECDLARFAPGERAADDLLRHEHQAETLLTEFGNLLRKEKRA